MTRKHESILSIQEQSSSLRNDVAIKVNKTKRGGKPMTNIELALWSLSVKDKELLKQYYYKYILYEKEQSEREQKDAPSNH